MSLVVVGMLLLVVMLTLESSFVWRTLLLVTCYLITWVQTVLIVLSQWKPRCLVLDVPKCSFAVTRVGKLESQDPQFYRATLWYLFWDILDIISTNFIHFQEGSSFHVSPIWMYNCWFPDCIRNEHHLFSSISYYNSKAIGILLAE